MSRQTSRTSATDQMPVGARSTSHRVDVIVGVVPMSLVLAMAVAGCTSSGPAATPHGTETSAATPPERTVSSCRPAQLEATVGGPGAAAGNVIYRIRIRDRGLPCSLRGRPTSLEGITAAKRIVRLRPQPLSREWVEAATTQAPADLSRGHPAEVVLHTGNVCGGDRHFRSWPFPHLRLGLTGHKQLTVRFGGPHEPTIHGVFLHCGRAELALSRFYAASPT